MDSYRKRFAEDPAYREYFHRVNAGHYQRNKSDYFRRRKAWERDNREHYLAWTREFHRKRRQSPHWAIDNRLHSRVWHAIGYQSAKKTSLTAVLIGCTVNEVRAHLQAQFEVGMTWENRNRWDIDHYLPCSMFSFEQEIHQRLCFNWRNLRPMWVSKNRAKHDRIPPDAMARLEEIASAIGIDFEAHRKYFASRLDKFRKVVK